MHISERRPGAPDCPERGGRTPSVRRPTIEGQGGVPGRRAASCAELSSAPLAQRLKAAVADVLVLAVDARRGTVVPAAVARLTMGGLDLGGERRTLGQLHLGDDVELGEVDSLVEMCIRDSSSCVRR